ncbi:MAG TPA: glycoside hydrolase family 3 C-terminal domain-containing protein [Bacteroidales bacterium]|nr:glycoside hydrolase family 3 C-terminal domain-containing protein [Bacteroidales bacterium]
MKYFFSIIVIIYFLAIKVSGQDRPIYFDPAFPVPVALAATWNPELIEEIAGELAEKVSRTENEMLLFPGLNIYRNPLSGRNFMSFGEDPYLSSILAGSFGRGAAKHQVSLCAGNYVLDNQEWGKPEGLELKVDETAMQEIYLPPFREAIRGGSVDMILLSANTLKGIGHIIEDGYYTRMLRQQWKYNASMAGPDEIYPILSLEGAGKGSDADIHSLAMEAARNSLVLLKNHGGLLPLDPDSLKSIALIGPNLFLARPYGGVTNYDPPTAVSPYESIKDLLGDSLTIWTAKGSNLADDIAMYEAASDDNIQFEINEEMIADAVEKAGKSDVAIIFAGLSGNYEGMGTDRPGLELPVQSRLIRAVYEANPNTIVVLQSGAAVDIEDWVFDVPAIMQAWYPGLYGSRAIAEAIFGHFNPSGKLPFTWAKEESDYPGLTGYKSKSMRVWYLEGVYLGYRHMDEKNIKARFPFGHGLTYTTFGIGKLMMNRKRDGSGWTATVEIVNMGSRTGTEVLQLYVKPLDHFNSRPEKELKAFKRVTLVPGQKKIVSIDLPVSSFDYYDHEKHAWTIDAGFYEILIATSAENIKLWKTVEIKETQISQ